MPLILPELNIRGWRCPWAENGIQHRFSSTKVTRKDLRVALPLAVVVYTVDSGGCGPDSSLCSFYRRCDHRAS